MRLVKLKSVIFHRKKPTYLASIIERNLRRISSDQEGCSGYRQVSDDTQIAPKISYFLYKRIVREHKIEQERQ